MSGASGAIKFLRDKCGFSCGDPDSEISRAWEAIEAKSAAYDALVTEARGLENRWRQYAENALANTPQDMSEHCIMGNVSSQVHRECAKSLGRLLLVREGGDA